MTLRAAMRRALLLCAALLLGGCAVQTEALRRSLPADMAPRVELAATPFFAQTPFGKSAFEAMQEQTRKNMAMFEQAMKMWTPFSAALPMGGPICRCRCWQQRPECKTCRFISTASVPCARSTPWWCARRSMVS